MTMEFVDLTTLLVGVFSFLLSFVCLRTWMGHHNRPSNFPPGPPGLPFLGNMLSLAREPHLKLTAWRQRYGDVFSLRLGPQDVVVLNGCAAIREALVRKGKHFSDRPSLFLSESNSAPKGIIMRKYGDELRPLRRFSLSSLRQFGVGRKSLEPTILEECRCVCQSFEDMNGGPFDASRIIQTAFSNVIAAIVFGRRFEHDNPDFQQQLDRTDRSFKLFLQAQALNLYPALRYVPGLRGLFNEWIKVTCGQTLWFHNIIEDHKKTFDPSKMRDVTDVCILEMEVNQSNDKKAIVKEENIAHIIGNLFIAGIETTTTTLSWALLYLALNPAWQQKVQEELDRVVGRDETPSYSRREDLPYTEATTLESQRIRTAVPLSVPHSTSSPTSLRGYHIPAGTQVWVNLWSVHMDPAYWTEPDKFDPGRFLDENGRVKVPQSFMPFSTGRRICLGEQLAKTELFLFLASLLQQFKFKLPEDGRERDLSGEMGATLLPRPYKLQAIPRETSA